MELKCPKCKNVYVLGENADTTNLLLTIENAKAEHGLKGAIGFSDQHANYPFAVAHSSNMEGVQRKVDLIKKCLSEGLKIKWYCNNCGDKKTYNFPGKKLFGIF